MMKCLYLFSVVIHMAAGCALSGQNNWLEITGYEGGSVLLPCSCADVNAKPQKFTWNSYRTGRLAEVLNEEQSRGRHKLFSDVSAANLSLLISDLREDDQGDYRCTTEKEDKGFWLDVKGCELVKKTEVEKVTGFTGESVVLPCVCADLQDNPKTVTWEFNYKQIYHEQTGHHRNRMKLQKEKKQQHRRLRHLHQHKFKKHNRNQQTLHLHNPQQTVEKTRRINRHSLGAIHINRQFKKTRNINKHFLSTIHINRQFKKTRNINKHFLSTIHINRQFKKTSNIKPRHLHHPQDHWNKMITKITATSSFCWFYCL